MNRYIAAIIDTLNRHGSMTQLSRPQQRIKETIQKYKNL
jgi:ribose-phosphate pyrophosphokinase